VMPVMGPRTDREPQWLRSQQANLDEYAMQHGHRIRRGEEPSSRALPGSVRGLTLEMLTVKGWPPIWTSQLKAVQGPSQIAETTAPVIGQARRPNRLRSSAVHGDSGKNAM